MRAVVLSDNIPWNGLEGEWGLSVHIAHRGTEILLDAGASGLFWENAKRLGIDLSRVNYAVLSHGHSDHSDGMETFFETVPEARFYVRPGCDACYMLEDGKMTYGGVPQAVVERFGDWMTFVEGDLSPSEGVWLIPHKTPGLAAYGEADGMYIARGGKLEPDDYAHEQSLVIETDQGLVIFNSCSHGGADNIIREVGKTFPGKRLLALVGGFHLFRRTDGEVRALARRIRDTGVGAVYTGHCTGTRALEVLAEELGSLVHPFHTGLVMEI